ncbi:MAG: hypothetical protein HY819_23635 [Acidobacteria bacterium]|nr:hypothetical protein [Acidobacteriota bacterium]
MAIKNLFRKSSKKKPSKKEDSFSDNNNGVIKFDTGKLKLPTQLIEEQGEMDKPFWQIEPIIIAIFILAIAFIGFITLLISRMPLPTK